MISRKVILILAACVFPLHAGEIPEKAERYRTMLLKKPENAVLFGRMMDAWLEEKELESLKPELELRAKEGGAADWRLLAVFHEHSGDEEAALKALDEAVKLSPEDAATRLARGKALGAALRFDGALEDLALASKDKALEVEASTLRGKLLARAGRPAEAVKAWQELIAANPADEGLKEDLIELEIGEGMLDEAVTAARELAAKTEDPYKKALRRLQVAEILAQAGKKDESLAEYREVFAVSADGSWLEREVLARAGALFGREDDSAGLKEFLAALREAYPRRVAVKKEAAKSLLAAGEGDEAVAMFREVLKVLPGDREVREEFIGLLEGAERPKDAADELAALLETAKDDAVLWERLAGLKKLLGDPAGLKEALDRALALMPADESGDVARARLLERFEKFDEAGKVLADAVAKHGKAGEAGEALAGFLIAREKGDEAIAMWKEMALTADREGLLRIARSLSAHGKASEAFAMLQPRVKDFPDDPLLLAALCQAAQLGDDPEAAVPQALELVRQAKSPTDLDAALRMATGLVSRAKDPRKWLDELAAKKELTLQERCLLSEMHESLGDSIQAEKVLKEAMAGDDTLLAATQRVRLLEMRGNSEEAVAAMREMIALPGGAKTAHVKRLVELLERAGDFDGALAETTTWLKLAPGDKLAWTKRADLFLGEGRAPEAVAELRRALAKFGGDEDLRAKLADAQREAGMAEEAWRSFTALYDEAESPAAKLKWTASLARMAAIEGKEEELVKDFRRRSRDNPSSVVPLLALAEMFKEWMNAEEELKCVDEALRRKPEDSALRFRLADLEEAAGNNAKAEGILRGMLSGAEAPEARRRMAAFWIRQGETERGLRELLEAGKNTDPRVIERLLMALVGAKEWESAARVLERESAARPEDWRLGYFHAVALLESERTEEAFAKFAALLAADGEIKGVMPLQSRGMSYPQPAARNSPPTRQVIPGFRRMQGSAFAHRGEHDPYSYGMSGRGEVALPGSPQEVWALALHHALAICQADEEKRGARLARLQSPHLDDLESLKRAFFLGEKDFETELAKDDADPGLIRWYLENLNYTEDPRDMELMLRSFRLAVKSDIELALAVAARIRYGGEKGAGAEVATEVMDLFEKLDGKKRQVWIGLLSGIAFQTENLPAEILARAEKMLIETSRTIDGKAQGNWIVAGIPVQWMRQGRFKEAVEWINRVDAEKAGKPRQFQNNGMPMQYWLRQSMGGGGQSQGFPQTLASMVSYQFQELAGNRNANRQIGENEKKLLKILGESGSGSDEEEQALDLEALVKVTPEIKDPVLRIYFYHLGGKTEEVAREIGALAKSPDAGAAELMLAASHHLTEGKSPVEAFALLVKARELPVDAMLREKIDTELVAAGTKLAAAKDKEVDLEPAKRAALRMRKSMGYDPDLKTVLASAMTQLGMEEESRRFTAAPVTIASGRNPYASMRGGMRGGSRGTKLNEIPAMIRDGKREAAARMMLQEVRRLAGDRNNTYELDQICKNATSLKLVDEMIRLDAPAPGAGFNRRRGHALLLVRFGKKEAALPMLRELAKEKPQETLVRTALFSVLPKEEQQAKLETLAAEDYDADALSVMFEEWLNERKVERHLESLEALAMFLETLKPSFENDRNLSWVNYMVKDVSEDTNLEVQVRPLLGSTHQGMKYDDGVTKKRNVLAARIYRAMLSHPQTAEQGFILLYATREKLEVKAEELDRAAITAGRAKLRMSGSDAMRNNFGRSDYLWAWIRGNGSGTSGGPPSGGLPTAVYLSRRAAEGMEVKLLDDAFLEELSASGKETADMIGRCRKVVAAEGTAAFKEWAEGAEKRINEMARELTWIVRLAEANKRTDLLELAGDLAAKTILKNDQRVAEMVAVLAQAVSTPRDAATRNAAIERMTKTLLGPPEAWPLFAAVDENVYIQGIQNRRQAFQSFIHGLSQDRAAAVMGARFVSRHGLVKIARLDESFLFQVFTYQPGPADLLESGFLDPGPEIIGSIDPQESQSMLGDVIERMKNQGDQSKKHGEELLKVEGPRSFWARITGAVLTGNTAAALKEIDRGSAVWGKWSPTERAGFAKLIQDWFPDAAAKAGGVTRKMLTESLKKGDDEARKQVEAYLKDGFPANFQPWTVDETVRPLVIRMLAEDPALAAKLWDKALEACRKGNNNWGSSNGGFQSSPDGYVHGELLEALMNQKVPIPATLGFLVEFAKLDSARKLGVQENNLQYYTYNRLMSVDTGKDKSIVALPANVRKFASIYGALGKETPPEGRPLLAAMAVGAHFYQSIDGKALRAGALAWAEGDLKKIDPALSDSAVLVILANDAPNLDDAARKNLCKRFVSFASNAAIPVEWRITALRPLLSRDKVGPLLDTPECAKAAVDLLASFMVPERNWASSYSISLATQVAGWTSMPPDQARLLLDRIAGSGIRYSTNGGDSGARGQVAKLTLDLALRIKDDAAIANAVREAGAAIRGRLDLAVELWKGGQNEQAKFLLARPGEFHAGTRDLLFGSKADGGAAAMFDKELEAALPGWLAGIEDASQRFRMECLLACGRDAEGDRAPSVKRLDRVAALVKRFPAEAPKPKSSRLETLAALGLEPGPAAALAAEYKEAIKGEDLAAIALERSGNHSNQARPYDETTVMTFLIRTAVRIDLEATGDASEMMRQVELMQLSEAGDGNNEYYMGQAMDAFFDWHAALLLRRVAELEGDARAKATAQVMKICELLLSFQNSEMNRDVIALGPVVHALAGDGAGFDRWLAGLDEEKKKRYGEIRKQTQLRLAYATIHESSFSGEAFVKPRRALLTALLTDPVTVAREIKHPTDLSGLMDSQAFTRDDLFAVIDALPADHPQKVEFLTEKAGIIGWRTDDKEAAIQAYDAADAAAAAKGDPKSIANAKAYRAKYLDDRQGKLAEAAAIAKELKPDELGEKERKWMEDLVKKAASKK
jgi:tetratricopeptide (TPR) repeat protein